MKWYADNSELTGIEGAEIPDILLFGGLIVPAESESQLQAQIEEIKRRYGGHSYAPVTWNLKDVKKLYHGKDWGLFPENCTSLSERDRRL